MWGEIPQRRCTKTENVDISDVIQQAQQPNCLSNYDIASKLDDTKDVTYVIIMNCIILQINYIHKMIQF